MVRTQIQLTDKQARKLRTIAREQGISLAELIRRCIDRMLSEPPTAREELYARAAELVGRFRDPRGAQDLSTDHDRYLDEAFG